MENAILEFKTKPVLYVCSSKREIEQMVESSKSLSKGRDIVLLFNYSERNLLRALPAFVNASIKFNEGASRASSMQIEMLMLLCGTTNIGKALRVCGARNSSSFLVFASSPALFARFARSSGIISAKRVKPKLDTEAAGNVAVTELLNG